MHLTRYSVLIPENMFAFKVELKKAQKAKEFLRRRDVLARGFKAKRGRKFAYFPLSKRVESKLGVTVTREFERAKRTRGLKEVLANELTARERELFSSAFDLVGDIAVLEVKPELRRKEKLIARSLLESNKRVRTVLRKDSAMEGEFRVRRLKWLAGEKKTLALHKESGCLMKVDLAKDFFSTRLGTERLRLAKQVKDGERVLALFSGVGPYALVIAKKKKARVVAIELNPHAVRLARENLALNKLKGSIELVEGDVNEVVPRDYALWANRIAMPLPHTGANFLDAALAGAADDCIIHYYCFAPSKYLYSAAIALVKRKCVENKVRCRILRKRVVRPYAPNAFQIVIDFKVKRKK